MNNKKFLMAKLLFIMSAIYFAIIIVTELLLIGGLLLITPKEIFDNTLIMLPFGEIPYYKTAIMISTLIIAMLFGIDIKQEENKIKLKIHFWF